MPFVNPVLSDETFALFRELIHRETGIFMRESKKVLIVNRLRKRIRETGADNFEAYYRLLKRDEGEELSKFVNAVATNETCFYRGESHFVALREVILPELFARKSTVAAWSAGCSTGEEPYTIAMVALEAGPSRPGCSVEILGTDISTSAISQAEMGTYAARSLRFLPPLMRDRYFERTPDGHYRPVETVRRHVRFAAHNLLRDDPPAGKFDVIFCRNVMIYFDTPTQKRLVEEKFAPALAPDGYLFVGHAESLLGKSSAFGLVRVRNALVYRPLRKVVAR